MRSKPFDYAHASPFVYKRGFSDIIRMNFTVQHLLEIDSDKPQKKEGLKAWKRIDKFYWFGRQLRCLLAVTASYEELKILWGVFTRNGLWWNHTIFEPCPKKIFD